MFTISYSQIAIALVGLLLGCLCMMLFKKSSIWLTVLVVIASALSTLAPRHFPRSEMISSGVLIAAVVIGMLIGKWLNHSRSALSH